MNKALEVVRNRLTYLEHLGKITGDPNNYWRVKEAEKILELLEESNILDNAEKETEENAAP